MKAEMISRCGLVCSECPAFLATKAKDEVMARKTAEQWSRMFNIKVEVEHVWCNGCLGRGRHCSHWAECEIQTCAKKRRLKNCAACRDYPCQQLQGFFKMVPEAEKRLDALRGA